MQPDLSSKGRAVPLAAVIISASDGSAIPAGYVGLWSDGTTLFCRKTDGSDAVMSPGASVPLFVAVTKTTSALPACIRDAERGAVKIGFSCTSLAVRLRHLQNGNPSELRLIGSIPGSILDEHELHRRFAQYRIRGEWFREDGELREYLVSIVAPDVTA